MKGVGEAAGKDLVEDGGRAAGEVRIEDFHPGVNPGGGVFGGNCILELESC